MRLRVPGIPVLAASLVFAAACDGASKGPDPTADPPPVDLAGSDPAVRTAIATARAAAREPDADAEIWARYGDVLATHGFRVEAADAYGRAARAAPDEPRFRYLEGHALLGVDLSRAAEAFADVVAAEPSYAPARVRLAQAEWTLGRVDRAATVLAPLSDDDPWVQELRAGMAAARGDDDEALDLTLRALEALPAREELRRNGATFLRRAGRADEARDLLAAAPGDPPPVMPDPWLERVSEPVGAVAWANEGKRQEDAGRDVEAVEAYRRSIAQRDDRHEVWIRLARTLGRTGNAPGALQAWSRARALRPEDMEAAAGFGRAALAAGRVDEALAALENATADERADAGTWMDLGLAAARTGDLARAQAALEEAAARDPDDAAIAYNLGIVRAQRGDLAGAIAAFERAATLDPADDQIRAALAAAKASRDR